MWKKVINVIDKFWEYWRQNYLFSLRERKNNLNSERSIFPKIGEVVLIEQEMLPRGAWRLGRIIKLSERWAELQISGGKKNETSLVSTLPFRIR